MKRFLGFDAEAGGLGARAAVSNLQGALETAYIIHKVQGFLQVSFASWEKSVDEQQLLMGNPFKAIPTGPPNPAFVTPFK
ncbi:MAG: hypothetical protein ACRD2O_11545 [Terriglobia bacterium]